MVRTLLGLAVVLLLSITSSTQAYAQRALVIQDVAPWGSSAVFTELTNQGVPYDTVGTASIGAVNVNNYTMIFVMECQGNALYNAWNANLAMYDVWVQAGGFLAIHACHESCGGFGNAVMPRPPGGVPTSTLELYNNGNTVLPGHPLMFLVPPAPFGNYFGHDSFPNTGEVTDVVLNRSAISGNPSYFVRPRGFGEVAMGGVTYSYGYDNAQAAGQILTNEISYALGFGVNPCGAADADADGVGDLCDVCPGFNDAVDFDADTIPDGCDNCPQNSNVAQADSDGDGNGDSCDVCAGFDDNVDADGDLVADGCDLCPGFNDGADTDLDGLPNGCDPCPNAAFEADADGDGDWSCTDCDDLDPARSTLDADGDGLTSCNGDCDDYDPLIHPLGVETADGRDQNCDGIVDEGTIWYDDDGDGYTEEGGDCDDGDPAVGPAELEVCDLIDQDCDLVIDEETECYDDDGDGYCEGPACSDASLPGDCNDGRVDVNPGAVDLIGDGIDNDCNGLIDNGLYDPDEDGFLASAGDCDEDNSDVYPGAPELEDGLDNDCDGLVDEGTDAYDDDGDGFTEDDGDCNDDDPDVGPGEAEVAMNGVDDDCDGAVDEDSAFTDDDGDGFSEVAGDCDDANADIFPGQAEVPNAVDDDCDGAIDEGLEDFDDDGYTAFDGDCNDGDGWINPEAPELCDGIDNNCDGAIDEGNCLEGDAAAPKVGGCSCNTGSAMPGLWMGIFGLFGLSALRRPARARR